MEVMPHRPKGRDEAISSLNLAIEAMNPARGLSSITTRAVFGTVSTLLAVIKVCSLLICDGTLRARVWLGLDGQQTGL